ncbi:MAG TPA: hypothetical protein VK255_04705 [Patescibacteria group bacterium]|nr:hypothetical protein [Patescibacteria group bacterium]
MNRLKYILLIFLPKTVFAQVNPGSGGMNRPNVWNLFTSLSSFLYVILGGLGALSVVGLLLAAIDYLAAGGDEERVQRSGKIFAFSLIGLLIAFLGIFLIGLAKSSIRQ